MYRSCFEVHTSCQKVERELMTRKTMTTIWNTEMGKYKYVDNENTKPGLNIRDWIKSLLHESFLMKNALHIHSSVQPNWLICNLMPSSTSCNCEKYIQ